MQDCKSIYIFGYSGHAYVLIESMLDLGYTIMGYLDKKKALLNPYNLKYLGFELNVDLGLIINNDYVFPTVGEAPIREKLVSIFINFLPKIDLTIFPTYQFLQLGCVFCLLVV